jgi:hypothetical protein
MNFKLFHLRRNFHSARWAIPLALLASTWMGVGSARAQTYGTLSNFDVFNDTGEDCHGFEIELHGLSSREVLSTFGEPYERYGNPIVEDFADGVYVRYVSPFDPVAQAFTQTTPMAPAVITPTDGHACWTGGSGNYLTAGCEHFGLQLTGNPSATVYRWLVADPATPGALRPSGTKVSIPAPLWSVSPPPPNAPDQIHPVIAAVIAPEPPQAFEFGDAIWVKVFKTEAPDAAELHHLVTDDPAVPQEAGETEIEWALLQASLNNNGALEQEAQIGEGNESVTRRYEFYAYTGPYDAETHEARPQHDSAPSDGEVGNYIGAQMAAINLGPLDATPTPTETPAPTATATVPGPPPCTGDCNLDGTVTVGELITGVNIALGNAAAEACAAFDGNADGQVTVDELVAAVSRLLLGCA